MGRFILKLGFCILTVLFLQNCAFTDSVIKLDYTPPDYPAKVNSPKEIVVKKLRDERGVEPTLIAQKGVRHKTSGRFLSEKEVGDFLTDAIKATLSQSGYKIVSGGGDFTLSGQLMKFDSQAITGFWSGTLEASVQANMKLSDNRTNAVVWHEIVSGSGRLEGLQMDGDDNRKEVTEKAVGSFMKKLVESEGLRSILGGSPQEAAMRSTSPSSAKDSSGQSQ